jgi:hypothetical protein
MLAKFNSCPTIRLGSRTFVAFKIRHVRAVLTRVRLVERLEYVFFEKRDLRSALLGEVTMRLEGVCQNGGNDDGRHGGIAQKGKLRMAGEWIVKAEPE